MQKELLFHESLSDRGEQRITGIYVLSKLVKVTTSQAFQ